MRLSTFSVLIILACYFQAHSSPDTTIKRKVVSKIASIQRQTIILPDTGSSDSVAKMRPKTDSISIYIFPNPRRESNFLITLLSKNPFDTGNFKNKKTEYKKDLKAGQLRYSRKPWLIETVLALLLYTNFLILL